MLIEAVLPQLIGGVDTLLVRLAAEGRARGLSEDLSNAVVAMLPPNLAACGCFLDRLTGIWRYEFGLPHRIGNELIWGVRMWPRARFGITRPENPRPTHCAYWASRRLAQQENPSTDPHVQRRWIFQNSELSQPYSGRPH